MKKLSKTLLLLLIFSLVICTSVYATEDSPLDDSLTDELPSDTPPIDTVTDVILTDEASNVVLKSTTAVVPENSVFYVETVTEEESIDEIKSVLGDAKFSIFITSLTLNDEAVTLSENVTLSFPIPAEYTKENVVLYTIDGNNALSPCTTTLEDTSIVVNTNTLGRFVLAEIIDASEEDSSTPEEQPPKDVNISLTDTVTNIKLDANEGIIPSTTTLNVVSLTSGESFDNIKTILGDVKFVAYDITLLDNGVAATLNGKVKLSIPIPSDFDSTNLIAYRIEEDSTKIEYPVTVSNNMAIIETDHFSNYVLAEKTVESTDVTPEEEQTTNNGTLDEEPKTGIENPVSFILSVLVFAVLGLAICIKKISK